VPEPTPAGVALPPAPGLQVPALDAYSFRLVVTRKLYDQGTHVQQAPHLAPLATPSGQVPVRLNPADLGRLGVEPGDRVTVSSARGRLTVEAQADAGVPKGIAAFVHDPSTGGALALVEPGQAVTDVHVETLS
jgi:anaerobic selenocysteine-containing dehydrogenase